MAEPKDLVVGGYLFTRSRNKQPSACSDTHRPVPASCQNTNALTSSM